MTAPKPQSRPRLVPPVKNQAASPFRRISSAPKTFGKSRPGARITSCIHVLKGGVWCIDCASAFRVQARASYARALRESQRGDVIRAAQEMLVKALKEYALTSAGITELEREYTQLISVNRPEEAKKLVAQIETLRKEISERNIASRKNEEMRKARMTTAISHAKENSKKYISAPRDSEGTWTTAGCSYTFTIHTKERMELRSISEAEIVSAFHSFVVVKPRGRGMWAVAGKNGVTLYGFFEEARSSKLRFIITTVFRPADNEEETELI